MTEITFKTLYWSHEETEDDKLVIHVRGKTQDNKSVYVKILNFQPYVYVEIPNRINNSAKCEAFIFSQAFAFFKPQSFKPIIRENLYGRKETKLLIVFFTTDKLCKMFANKCRKGGFMIEGLGYFKKGELSAHEDNINPILKFTGVKNLDLANWIKVKEFIPPEEQGLSQEERKFSICDIDMYCNLEDVESVDVDMSISVPIKSLEFDLETYSKNHNSKNPDPVPIENIIFQIGCIVGYVGQPNKKRYLLTLGNPVPIESLKIKDDNNVNEIIQSVTILNYKTEKDLILGFRDFINEHNPDIFIGYNIMKFDWNYLVVRAGKRGIQNKFKKISSLLNDSATIKEMSWTSSAYGQQKFAYLEIKGMIQVDVLPEIERNHKLPNYKLDTVAEHFLKEKKDPISHYAIFMVCKLMLIISKVIYSYKNITTSSSKSKKFKYKTMTLTEIKDLIRQIMNKRRTNGIIKEYRKRILKCKSIKSVIKYTRTLISIIGKYCVRDCELSGKLVEKLNLTVNMMSMSNIMCVPMSYLHTRGQQIKVLSQIYRETLKQGMFIPYFAKSKDDVFEKFQGATVIEANPGIYDDVGTCDFESLYPSVIITFNICYSTLITDNSVPDSECNILEINEHRHCEHDKTVEGSKRDKKKFLCNNYIIKFRKVKVLPDGTRENEGVLPKILRNLLDERKKVKKEKAKYEAKLNMHLGKATQKEIDSYKKKGYEIIQKGSLSSTEEAQLTVLVGVLEAHQLAIKVSSNSIYGGFAATSGFIPCIPCARSVTGMGRKLIIKAINYILQKYKGSKLIYGDTDSCMINFGKSNVRESYDTCEKASDEATHYLRSTLLGVDENYTINIKGTDKKLNQISTDDMKYIDSDDKKVLVHTYNSYALRLSVDNMYGRFLLLTKKRYAAYSVNRDGEILKVVKKGIVLTRRDNCQFLRTTYEKMALAILDRKNEDYVMDILYTHINMLFTRQIPDSDFIIYTGVKDLLSYAKKDDIGNYLDKDDEIIRNVTGPLDTRLVYRNIPQVLLSIKMTKRGDEVPANTRLEYLYVENENATHQGQKAEDFTYYKENKSRFKIDYLHYLEKQLSTGVTELLTVRYKHDLCPYIKPEDEIVELIKTLDENEKYGLKLKKLDVDKDKFTDKAIEKIVNHILKCKKTSVINNTSKNVEDIEEITDYKVDENINLDNVKVNEDEVDTRYYINENKHPRLIYICRVLKSRYVIYNLYKKHGLKKRPALIKPQSRGCSYYYKDSRIMENVLMYRTYYKQVVNDISLLGNQVIKLIKPVELQNKNTQQHDNSNDTKISNTKPKTKKVNKNKTKSCDKKSKTKNATKNKKKSEK